MLLSAHQHRQNLIEDQYEILKKKYPNAKRLKKKFKNKDLDNIYEENQEESEDN